MTTDTRGTTTEYGDFHWSDQAACAGKPDAFDTDVIGKDTSAIRAAVRICTRQCPVLAECRAWTESLAPSKKPQGLVQAGRVWKARFGNR